MSATALRAVTGPVARRAGALTGDGWVMGIGDSIGFDMVAQRRGQCSVGCPKSNGPRWGARSLRAAAR